MPVTVSVPESVIAPEVLTPNVPETVEAPRTRAFASVTVTLFPLVISSELKLLAASSRVISFPDPAASVVAPVMVSVPESVIAPVVLTPKVPETVEAPRTRAFASVIATLFPVVMATVL